jgi:hypothetical protein
MADARRKTLIIGVGGTGLAAIHEVRRLIAERYEKGMHAPEVAATRFLYIDTDDGDVKKHSWSVLGKDISLKDGEKVVITGDNLKPLVESPENYPSIREWLPPIGNYIGDPGPGAKGIRPYGRLIYEYSANSDAVKKRLITIFNELNGAFPQSPHWRVYLVCGLSGGTGSGMFLPLSSNLLEWGIHQKGLAARKFYSFLVLPPLTVHGLHDRYHANAYAALKEVNHKALNGGLPYDNCYLVEPVNADGHSMPLETLPTLIAQRIFLNIQAGPAAAYVDSLMDNPSLGNTEGDDDPDRRHALCFSSFGLSAVSYPREIIAKCLAHHLAGKVVEGWLIKRDHPQNVNQIVRNDLAGMRLSKDHVFGDSDPFGSSDYQRHSLELENAVAEKVQAVEKGQLSKQCDKIRSDVESGFRNKGIREFYQQREKDAEGATEKLCTHVRKKVTDLLRDADHGLAFAKLFLDHLVAIMDEMNGEMATLASDETGKKIERRRKSLDDTRDAIADNERGLIYTRGTFEKDRNRFADQLKFYLKDLADHYAARYGAALLRLVIPRIGRIRDDLANWELRVSRLREALGARAQLTIEGLKSGHKEVGRVIFDREALEKMMVAGGVSPRVYQPKIEDNVRLQLKQDGLDLMKLSSHGNPEAAVFDAAYQWVISDDCPFGVKSITLYDKFVTDYPDSNDRQKIFKEAKSLSGILLRFTPSEVGAGAKPVSSTEASVVAIPDGVGANAADGRPVNLVVQDDLIAMAIPKAQVVQSDDQERIVFLQERQVFPLRFVESLRELKNQYDGYPHKQALHIDRRTVAFLYDLYALSAQKRAQMEEAEEAFLLARAKGWFAQKPAYGIRLECRGEEIGALGERAYRIDADWDTAFQRFVKAAVSPEDDSDDLRMARQVVSSRIRALRADASRDAALIQGLRSALIGHLECVKASLQDGIDDPIYKRQEKIATRVLGRLSASGSASA